MTAEGRSRFPGSWKGSDLMIIENVENCGKQHQQHKRVRGRKHVQEKMTTMISMLPVYTCVIFISKCQSVRSVCSVPIAVILEMP